MAMDISVIVPIYNVERYIEESLRSLFTQTKTDGVEFILVNDATPDGSMMVARGVIAEYPDLAITILDKPKNEGLAAARATGLSDAKGEYILHVDSDDWCEPTMLEELHRAAQEHDVDVVMCDYLYAFPNGKEVYTPSLNTTTSTDYVALLLGGELHENVWCKLARRSLYTQHPLRIVSGIDVWEDLLHSIQLLHFAEKVYYLPKAYVHYRVNPLSLTNQINPKAMKNIEEAVTEVTRFLTEQQVVAHYNTALMHRKISAKNLLIKGSTGEEQRNYAKLYSEATPYIMSHPQRPYPIKLAIWLASKGCLGAANLLYTFVKWGKKVCLKC